MMKFDPAVGSISIFKNLGVFFQSMVVKFPNVAIDPASPITVVNKP